RPPVTSAINNRIELVPQSNSPILLMRASSSFRAGGSSPLLPVQDSGHLRLVGQHRQRLVTQRVNAASLGKRVRDQHVKALHPVGHASAGDLGAQRFYGVTVGQIARVGTSVRGGQLRVGSQTRRHLLHHPRGFQPAGRCGQRGGGEGVQRRKRGAVGKPRRGLD